MNLPPDEDRPVRNGGRVGHLLQVGVALAPDQLTRVEGDDDEDEEREGAAEHVQHRVGDGPGGGAVDLADLIRAEDQEEQPRRDDRGEVAVRDDAPERAARDRQHLAELRAEAEVARHGRQHQPPRHRVARPRRRGNLRAAALLRARSARVGEAEAGVHDRQDHQPDGHPQQAVREEQPVDGEQLRVPLGGRPVLGRDADGVQPEGVEQRRQPLVLHIRREVAGEQIADQKHRRADVVRQHLAGERGQREEDRADEQQVRQHQHPIRLQQRARHQRADLVLVQVRHGAADGEADRHAQKDQRTYQPRAREAPAEVGELRQRRREEERIDARVVVAEDRVSEQRGDHEHAQQRHRTRDRRQHVGRIGVGIAAAAADRDLHRIPRAADHVHQQESEHQEDAEVHPGRDAPQVVAELETGDRQKLPHAAPTPASSCVGSGAPESSIAAK